MAPSPVKVLQKDLDAGKQEREHTHLATRDFYDAEPWAVDDELGDFHPKYEELVEQFAKAWGPPAFDDGSAHPKFPKWFPEAVFLACWPKGELTAYVAIRHDDKELPLMLVYGITKAKVPQTSAAGKRARNEKRKRSD